MQLAQRGVCVGLHYRSNRTAAEDSLRSLAGSGHAIFDADLSDTREAALLWQRAVDALGPVDILNNNAGLYLFHSPLHTGYDEWLSAWQQTLATNLVGPANLSLLAAQGMAARNPRAAEFGRGRIVNVSSRGAFRGEPDAPAYGASKAGLNALSQSLAKALAPNAVYVYCVAPGWVETEMAASHLAGPDGPAILAQHPLGRVNRTDESCAGSRFLCARCAGRNDRLRDRHQRRQLFAHLSAKQQRQRGPQVEPQRRRPRE